MSGELRSFALRKSAALGRFVWISLGLALLLGGCAQPSDGGAALHRYRERLKAIQTHDFFQTTRVLDRNGTLLAELAPKGYRTWVPLADIPKALQHAVIATEDRTFYKNPGIDRRAFARAMVQNSQAGSTVSGASTITMQLVRLVAFDPEERYERSIERKVREVYLAAEVDETYSKNQIMEAYLNVAYFGNGAYGVETAARRYFGRGARDLSVAESTLLAGLLQAPSALDPTLNPSGAHERQQVVLDSMVKVGYLSREEAELVRSTPIRLVQAPEPPVRHGDHFVDYVMQEALPGLIGPQLAARGGFTVTTTIDLDLSTRLTAIAKDHVARLRLSHNVNDASIVVIHPQTGEILAMVGGIDYDDPTDGQVNMAARPRQPGSAFKPIAYAAALEAGWSPASTLWDVPLSFGEPPWDYQPTNFDGVYRGPIRLRRALGNSLNAAAIDLTAAVGLEKVHALALRMGLPLDPDPWHYGLSMTLGGAEVPLIDLTAAFSAFANGGRFNPAAAILKIEPMSGEGTLYVHSPRPKPVISPQTAWLISDILSDAAARQPVFQPGRPMQLSRPAAVKTGTTNDVRDTLTVGYTPYLTVGVWTGNSDGRPMGSDVLSSESAAPIWNAVMETIFADARLMALLGGGRAPVDGFSQPEGIMRATACEPGTRGRCQPIEEAMASVAAAGPSAACPGIDGQVGSGNGSMLTVYRGGRVAEQITAWAASRGIPVALSPCETGSQAY